MSETAPVHTFESLREAVSALRPARRAEDRSVVWADPTHTVGVARDHEGHVEIFVVGPPLEVSDPVVRENTEHRLWARDTGDAIPASRLLLPEAHHFDPVAAFICSELVANGAGQDVRRAFRRSEPVIALALRRALLGNQALVGLAGELFTLARLVQAAPEHADEIVACWHGSSPSTRDLQLGAVGVEIKTTSGSESTHHVQGFHQLERGTSVDDQPETSLFLLSIGIEWLPDGSRAGSRIPDLVESICRRLSADAVRAAFLARVQQYGGDAAVGYDHETHQTSPRFGRAFHTRFERLYDLDDSNLRLLRTADVEHAVHVQRDSVSFRVQLPKQVRGDLEPVAGMGAITSKLLGLMSG